MPCFSAKMKAAAYAAGFVGGAVLTAIGATTEVVSAGVTTVGSVPAMAAGIVAMITSLLNYIAALEDLSDCLQNAGKTDEATKLQQKVDDLKRDVDRLQTQKARLENVTK